MPLLLDCFITVEFINLVSTAQSLLTIGLKIALCGHFCWEFLFKPIKSAEVDWMEATCIIFLRSRDQFSMLILAGVSIVQL